LHNTSVTDDKQTNDDDGQTIHRAIDALLYSIAVARQKLRGEYLTGNRSNILCPKN